MDANLHFSPIILQTPIRPTATGDCCTHLDTARGEGILPSQNIMTPSLKTNDVKILIENESPFFRRGKQMHTVVIEMRTNQVSQKHKRLL